MAIQPSCHVRTKKYTICVLYVADDISNVYDKVCTGIQIGQNNSVLLSRILTRLEMVEDKISQGNTTSSSACSSDADTSILSGQFSDVSASSATIKPTSGLEHLAFLIPCETNDDVNELEEAMKDCASRQWMVRTL